MKRSHLVLGAVALFVGFGSTAQAQAWTTDELPACFELKLGPWTPPIGSAARFSTPPDTVKLFTDSTFPVPQPGWKRAEPPIRHGLSPERARAMWKPVDITSFRIIWSDGFTGADLRLFAGAGSHFGVIRMLSDAIAPEAFTPKATVVANRVKCKS
jgi:hypothetical protein